MKILKLQHLTTNNLNKAFGGIANAKVDGLKCRTKLLMTALAQANNLSYEAFQSRLNKLHNNAYYFSEKKAWFSLEGGTVKLQQIDAKIQIVGYEADNLRGNVSLFNGILDRDNYVTPVELTIAPGRAKKDFPLEQAMMNQQLAINAMFELANHINENLSKLTPASLSKLGFKIDLRDSDGIAESIIGDEWERRDLSYDDNNRFEACPSCGTTHDCEDTGGFTFPFQFIGGESYDFVVCQGCGRRTLDDDWNNPEALEAPLEEKDIIQFIKNRHKPDYIARSDFPSEVAKIGQLIMNAGKKGK